MSQMEVAIYIFTVSIIFFILAYNFPKVRGITAAIGFYFIITGIFATYSNWLPQVRGGVPEPPEPVADFDGLSAEKLAEMGENVIFGSDGLAKRGVGKGQCPLCHTFKTGDLGERAPNLMGISARAADRVKEDLYKAADFSEKESFSGSGRATNAIEYIAESHACPSCYVVTGFGEKGTNDKKSPMPYIHKGAIGLSIEEMIAVDTWLYYREGEDPPSVDDIRNAYEKFVPEKDRISLAPAGEAPAGLDPSKIALPDDDPSAIVKKMGCAACHMIPGIEIAKTGMIGPILVEKFNSPRRLASPEYKAAVKAGTAHAKTPKDYIIESITDPSAYIVKEFTLGNPTKSMMPPNFSQKFTYSALSNLADYLLQQDCESAKKAGLAGPPLEPIAKICG